MNTDPITAVRRFNRLVTQRIGALEDHFLGRKRPLGQSRVLFEIGTDGASLRELRSRLGLDSGYLTRLVQALEADGMIALETAPDDERVRRVRLTRRGLAEVREMDRRSDAGAVALLEALSDAQRSRLITAMDEVHHLLLAAGVRMERVHPSSRDARWCLAQYYAEIDRRFESGFDLSTAAPTPAREFVPPRGSFVVATVDGRPVGCGGVKPISARIGYLKRMWVSEEVRGMGVGKRLLAALEHEAAALGFTTLRLETNRALQTAIAMYRAAGYREIAPFNDEPYAHHWFEKRLLRPAAARAVSRRPRSAR